jgi:hypothetical protein
MNFKIIFIIVAVSSLLISSCDTSGSSRNSNTSTVQIQSLRNEKITCNDSTVLLFKYKDGTEKRQLEERVIQTQHQVQSSGNGQSYSESTGEVLTNIYKVIDDQTKIFSSKNIFNYVIHRTGQITQLPDGALKDNFQIVKTETAKAGIKYPDGNGGWTRTRTSNHTYELVTKNDGNRSTKVSSHVDGNVQPVYDYVTTTTTLDNTSLVRTILQTPYTVYFSTYDMTVEKSDQICQFQDRSAAASINESGFLDSLFLLP